MKGRPEPTGATAHTGGLVRWLNAYGRSAALWMMSAAVFMSIYRPLLGPSVLVSAAAAAALTASLVLDPRRPFSPRGRAWLWAALGAWPAGTVIRWIAGLPITRWWVAGTIIHVGAMLVIITLYRRKRPRRE